MTFPALVSYTRGASTTSPKTVTVPSGAVGDLLLLYSCGWSDIYLTGPSGFTALPISPRADGVNLRFWYRITDGSEAASYSLTSGTGNFICWLMARYSTAALVEVAYTNVSNDPPTLTPSWGSADTLWIAGLGYRGVVSGVTGLPSGFGNRYDTNTTTAGSQSLVFGELAETGSAKNPDVFSTTTSNYSRMIAFTLGLQPNVAIKQSRRRRSQRGAFAL